MRSAIKPETHEEHREEARKTKRRSTGKHFEEITPHRTYPRTDVTLNVSADLAPIPFAYDYYA